MSGAVCRLIINAVVRYEAVPSGGGKRKDLEAQLRVCYANPVIAQAVVDASEANAVAMWDILSKEDLTPEDLQALLGGLPEYST